MVCKRIFCVLPLIILALVYDNVSADSESSSTFSIDVSETVLQLSLSTNNISLDLSPSTGVDSFGSGTVIANVATNNSTGYTLIATTETTDLVGTTLMDGFFPVIPSLLPTDPEDQGYDTNSFTPNSWGYKTFGDVYFPIANTLNPANWVSDGPSNGTDNELVLGVKVDATLPSGVYKNNITFQVTANPVIDAPASVRQNIRIVATGFYEDSPGNPGVRGSCTWYAWYWRATDPRSLGVLSPEGRNARTWNINYAYRGVGNNPVVGAVIQMPNEGYYGHVGVVTAINPDGSIEIEEMGFVGLYIVDAATIPAENVGEFNYIY